ARGRKRALEIADADRVDLVVMPLDAAGGVLRELDRGNLSCLERGRQFHRGLETPFRLTQSALPHLFVANDTDVEEFSPGLQGCLMVIAAPEKFVARDLQAAP